METFWLHLKALLGFIGLTLETLFRSLVRPASWRVTPLVANIEKSGLDAVPIIALLTFLVGAVIAFLGATVLANFGATIYTVNLVVFSFLREFAVLLTAILMAGRTASAFTAQIGLDEGQRGDRRDPRPRPQPHRAAGAAAGAGAAGIATDADLRRHALRHRRWHDRLRLDPGHPAGDVPVDHGGRNRRTAFPGRYQQRSRCSPS